MWPWIAVLGPIFAPAALVFGVYALAKYGIWDTKRRPCTDDARPYDPHRIQWWRK